MIMTAGLGFKLEHLDEALTARNPGLWFEVHAENYMVDGGPRLRALVALAERFAISLHGVGLSLASVEPPAEDHLRRLRALADLIRPAAISDHLAWQKWEGAHHSDFLPFPRTRQALDITAGNVARVQDALGRTIMVENPSLYIDLPGHELDEATFLSELARRTGCGLLVDVNNIFVSAANLRFSPEVRLDAIPASIIGEVHLAGHRPDPDPDSGLLIDSHDAPVSDPVWLLYQRLIDRVGPRPTLIERDDEMPPFQDLMLERDRAHRLLEQRMSIDA
ncbi:uncharacterized protein (UPF0276 family) [Sphingomonas sp. BE270]|jgi:uncharacterized protein (UPF0276 family)|uniref:MNIO family bufferin maturase n=1 Tax=unclassified Sphingomonas TaxID=196159 RepID=UPI0010F54043|nr:MULTISPECIES: DUF692 domain-containing protein [unclassified Sphingomonas]MDR6848817.1 uncharacterized protein (UPF0276 family) [Sphingomonas sp. BE137]MDR7256101.1 uncharacterized protein (UPF0276 family) [Sphingomonas sp. BE270]